MNKSSTSVMITTEHLARSSPRTSHPPIATSKTELIAYVRGAFAFAHRAIATISADNVVTPLSNDRRLTRLGLTLEEIGHSENHYGQIVEYLRMSGIIPPASRPQTK